MTRLFLILASLFAFARPCAAIGQERNVETAPTTARTTPAWSLGST